MKLKTILIYLIKIIKSGEYGTSIVKFMVGKDIQVTTDNH